MNEKQKYDFYVLAELIYQNNLNPNNVLKNEELFPPGWQLNRDYNLKTDILLEATRDKILIKNTKKYNENINEFNK